MWRLSNQSQFCADRCVAGKQNFPCFKLFRHGEQFSNLFRCKLFSIAFQYTAAHCEHDRESGNPIAVKMGVIYIHDNGSSAQIIKVASITSHPRYKSNEKYFDIALIKLKSFIRFDEHVRPACVASGSESWPKMIAIGFGKTQYG